MKKWFKNIKHFATFLTFVLALLITCFPGKIIYPILLFIFISFIFFYDLLPSYSTNKYIKFLYNTKIFGKYKATLSFRTWVNQRNSLLNSDNKNVEFIIGYEGDNIIKRQWSDQGTISESYLVSVFLDKDNITYIFKYKHAAKYDNGNKLPDYEEKSGIEYIVYNHKNQEIVKHEYFNDKPGYGEFKKIEKINKITLDNK